MGRILVTGASGFVGRAIVAALDERGFAVTAGLRRAGRAFFPDHIEVRTHPDLREEFDWSPILDGVEAIIHLAGIAHTTGVPAMLHDQVNHRATARLARAAAVAGIRHFVFVSSIRAQCGRASDQILTELSPLLPTDGYGASKLAAEQAVRASGVPFTILRPVAVYGPGVKGNFASLLRVARSPFPLPLKGLTARRSVLSVENLASAFNHLLAAKDSTGDVFIVSDPGDAPTLSDIIAALRKARDRPPLLTPCPAGLLEGMLRIVGRSDVWDRLGRPLVVDVEKLLATGWRPPRDTPAGLARWAQAATP